MIKVRCELKTQIENSTTAKVPRSLPPTLRALLKKGKSKRFYKNRKVRICSFSHRPREDSQIEKLALLEEAGEQRIRCRKLKTSCLINSATKVKTDRVRLQKERTTR